MRWIKVLLVFVMAFILLFSGTLAYLTITDSDFEGSIPLSVTNNQVAEIPVGETIGITTLNIGYGGLDDTQVSYFEGGRPEKRADKVDIQENLDSLILDLDSTDSEIFFIQEVDIGSSRSQKIDQSDYFRINYPHFGSVFGINHDADLIPLPIFRPIGKVKSGLMTMSRYNILRAERHNLYNKDSWPMDLFLMDRCFIETRHPVRNGGELVLINLQLSPYNDKEITREMQLRELNSFISSEYSQGNYVIVGGDWSHSLPGTDPLSFTAVEAWPSWLKDLPGEFVPEGFSWAIDNATPTKRSLKSPYIQGITFKAVVDGFLVSDNISVEGVYAMDDDFANSHHNAVTLKMRIIN